MNLLFLIFISLVVLNLLTEWTDVRDDKKTTEEKRIYSWHIFGFNWPFRMLAELNRAGWSIFCATIVLASIGYLYDQREKEYEQARLVAIKNETALIESTAAAIDSRLGSNSHMRALMETAIFLGDTANWYADRSPFDRLGIGNSYENEYALRGMRLMGESFSFIDEVAGILEGMPASLSAVALKDYKLTANEQKELEALLLTIVPEMKNIRESDAPHAMKAKEIMEIQQRYQENSSEETKTISPEDVATILKHMSDAEGLYDEDLRTLGFALREMVVVTRNFISKLPAQERTPVK